jgi:hypothetical protein
MALILKDRVLESSTSTGTGSFTLTGAQTGYQSFTAIGNGNTTYYTIQGKNPDGTLTGEWEVGIGTWSTGNTLSRDSVLSNSLGTTAKIVFSAGAKDVFCDYPASKSVNQNADNKVIIPYTPGVTSVGSLNVGDATGHTDSGVIAAFTASEPLYLYTSLQNTSSANTSYASYAVNDGGHTSYGELGINNSNYSYTAAGYPNNTFSAPLATFVESYGGPLAIGTWDSQKISFIVNGSVNTADAMTINASGTINIPSLTASQAVFTDASKNLVSKAVTGTGSVVLDTNPSFTTDIEVRPFTSKFIGIGGGSEISNTVFGAYALANNTFGTNNIAIGDNALNQSLFGSGSIAIGTNAGSTITTGENNIYIGDSVSAFNSSAINEIVIGFGAIGIGSNKTVIGNSSTVETNLKGTTTVSAITATGSLQLTGSTAINQNIATSQTTGTLNIGGASATGAITLGRSTGAQTVNIATGLTAASTTKAVNIGTAGNATSTTNIAIGSTTGTSTTTVNGYFKPPALASAPTYVKGAVYFDTTLNKLRVGGATTWETITSV